MVRHYTLTSEDLLLINRRRGDPNRLGFAVMLCRTVFFNRLGEIRDRSYENQRHRASGLNLLVAAIVLWNTTYLQRAIDHLRSQEHDPAPDDLAHLSPLGWEHINLTGDYHGETSPALGPDQFRPLRTRAHEFVAAA
jgi:Tn3 transposase DDE domain/Domain of unknown function (DUF4158)